MKKMSKATFDAMSLIVFSLMFLAVLPTNVFAFDMDISISPTSKVSTNCGGQESATVSLTNKGNSYGALCWWSLDKSSWTKGTSSCLSPEGGTGTASVNLVVPTSGSTTHTVYVACRNYGHWGLFSGYVNDCVSTNTWSTDYTEGYTKSTNCLINSQQDADCIYQQTVTLECNTLKQQAESEKNTAQTLISDAQTAISNAQKKIQEATNAGVKDVTSANSYLTTANSDLQNANTYLSSAKSSYDAGNYNNAITQAQSAQTSANSAKKNANDAYDAANKLLTALTQAKTDASNKLSSALSGISSAKDMAKKADDIIQNATVLGLDTIQSQTDVKSARAKLETAQNYYNEANTAFTQGNYDLTKQKADSAISYAKDAETLANQAYSSLSTVISISGEAAKAVTQANSEIAQTDEILTKMVYIERSVEKWGVNLSQAKDITSTGQSNIDVAKDLLAQAKNRFQAGKYTEATNVAIESRDKAAEPTNRLSRIVSSMSLSTQDALEKAYSDAQTKVTNAENSVKDAQNTYAATQSEIIAAQNDLAAAKSQLSNASSSINEVKSATDLAGFVSKASLAFSALDDANAKTNSAVNHANAAKMGLVTTVAIPAAGAAAAIGGGFLYWRKRQSKHKKHGVGKELEEAAEEVEKIAKMICENCGKEFLEIEKFCSNCGKELKKIVEEKPMKHRKRKS